MLHEYAVEPEAIVRDWQTFRYLFEKFGFDQGRLISRFPGKWKRDVYNASRHLPPLQRKRIEERLSSEVESKLTPSGRDWPNRATWIENAIAAQAERAFHAIIASHHTENCLTILTPDEVVDTHPLFAANRSAAIPRKASDFANAVAPLFWASRDIIFIDPHFEPSIRRWRNPLVAMLTAAAQTERTFAKIEYHTKAGGAKPSAEEFQRRCEQFLVKLLPSGLTIDFFRWEETDDRFHGRYILTNVGGINVEGGLDETEANETTDIHLLDADMCALRRAQFTPCAERFNPTDHIQICNN